MQITKSNIELIFAKWMEQATTLDWSLKDYNTTADYATDATNTFLELFKEVKKEKKNAKNPLD